MEKLESVVQRAHAQQRRVSVQRRNRMDSGEDVGCVLLLRARRRVSVPSECSVVAA